MQHVQRMTIPDFARAFDDYTDTLSAKADTDGDGVLDLSEIEAMERQIKADFEARESEMERLDVDHDGKISQEEWDTLDVNRDGKISQEELFDLREKANLSNNNAAPESDVKTSQQPTIHPTTHKTQKMS